MGRRKLKVALLLAGGTAWDFKNPRGSMVRSQEEAKRWIFHIQSLLFGTTLVPYFFYDGEGLDTPPSLFYDLGKFIEDHYDDYDGFVVTVSLPLIPFTSAAMAFFFGQTGKPIVVSGSPLSLSNETWNHYLKAHARNFGILGPRAQILGACIVAGADVGEICTVYGNKIFWPTRLISHDTPGTNFFESIDLPFLGRVDFGIQFFIGRNRQKIPLKSKVTWDDAVAWINTREPDESAALRKAIEGKHGLIFECLYGEIPSRIEAEIRKFAKKFPVIIYGPLLQKEAFKSIGPYLWIQNMTRDALLAKLKWALGQTDHPRECEKIILSPRANEFYIPKKEKKKPE